MGAALNVHEGPHSISTRYGNVQGLKEGMICSNEPGYCASPPPSFRDPPSRPGRIAFTPSVCSFLHVHVHVQVPNRVCPIPCAPFRRAVNLNQRRACADEPGGFGIRIENLLVVTKRPTPHAFNDKAYLGFDQLTHVPIQASLIEPSLLTPAEVVWLDSYHQRVWERISPRLEPDSEGYAWLRAATRPLAEHGLVSRAAADAAVAA